MATRWTEPHGNLIDRVVILKRLDCDGELKTDFLLNTSTALTDTVNECFLTLGARTRNERRRQRASTRDEAVMIAVGPVITLLITSFVEIQT